jgi:5'-methylthioadenosine phosphorylase
MSTRKRQVDVGLIAGSGLYDLAGLEDVQEVTAHTPFGETSDLLRVGTLGGRSVAFLSRHGRQHTLIPTEINYRANIYAMKALGAQRILSASAVGSLREAIGTRDLVVVDQFIDRTCNRHSTFFGDGVAAHIGFAEPICPQLAKLTVEVARDQDVTVHSAGTYVCIEGPSFSTRAESLLYRSWGADVIGMTNLQEAKLAREAEICYATLALVTDYDCWHESEADVSVAALLDHLRANSEMAARLLAETVSRLPDDRTSCSCGDALSHALITPREAIPERTRSRLRPLLERYLD